MDEDIVRRDWDKYGASSSILILDYNLAMKKFQVVRRVEVPKVEYSFDKAVNMIIELNKIYQPSFIYADRGMGEYQLETLHIYGEKHPESGLKLKLKGFQFSQNIEITDPVTKQIEKAPMKPFMVNQLAITFERGNMILSPFDETLHKQLVDYSVEKISANGKPIYTSINEHFVDIIFLGFEGASQTFINENVYQLGIDNPQAYLKSKKLKCEAKDLQRVEDLLKKGKSCESMAKAIGEKNMSKAGSRFVASLRLLNLPVPPFDDDAEAEQEIMRYYSDFFNSVSTNNPEVHKSLNKIKTLCPGYFAKKFLELGGTMEDIFAMYDASYGDEANPDTITARQQKINSFSKATTEKYGRLKDFVVFLDSLNIPYSVDPIDKRTTSGWGGSKQEWQGVTLFDDDDPNTAHFAITSSEGMVRGNGDRVGSYRVDGGGWTRYGYRSRYKAEYAQNGNWRMEGDLEVIHISDNLKPFLKEGPINLTQVRNAIKKFLKSIGK